jgi:hypothetical protein
MLCPVHCITLHFTALHAPVAAHLASSSNVCDGVHHPTIEVRQEASVEPGVDADPVRAVPVTIVTVVVVVVVTSE